MQKYSDIIKKEEKIDRRQNITTVFLKTFDGDKLIYISLSMKKINI